MAGGRLLGHRQCTESQPALEQTPQLKLWCTEPIVLGSGVSVELHHVPEIQPALGRTVLGVRRPPRWWGLSPARVATHASRVRTPDLRYAPSTSPTTVVGLGTPAAHLLRGSVRLVCPHHPGQTCSKSVLGRSRPGLRVATRGADPVGSARRGGRLRAARFRHRLTRFRML